MWKKIIVIGMVFLMGFSLFCGCLLLLNGCHKTNYIPNGKYIPTDTTLKSFILSDNGSQDTFLQIKDNKAIFYISGWDQYRCNIKKDGEKIIFIGYTWIDPLSGKTQGKEFYIEVSYNTIDKIIDMNEQKRILL